MPAAHSQPHRFDAILPWMVSFTFHMALGFLGCFVYFMTEHVLTASEERPIIVTSAFEDSAYSENPALPEKGGGSRQGSPEGLKDLARSEGWGPNATQNVSALLGNTNQAVGIFNGTGAGVAGGTVGQPGSPAVAYGGGGGGAAVAPRSSFSGTSGNAVRIVYLIDCTASLVDIFGKAGEVTPGTVKAAVQTSVNNLVPLQLFHVFVFTGPQDGGTISLAEMARATPENKALALKALSDRVAVGGDTDEETSFIKAFRRAFQDRPDLIYFFTDGNLSDGVLQDVRALNKQHATCINAIMFNYEDQLTPADTQRYARLEKLAKENGGMANLVTAKIMAK